MTDSLQTQPVLKTKGQPPIDIGRWSRKERRNLAKRTGLRFAGRTLPYNKQAHGSIHNYYNLLENDVKKDHADR